MDTPSSSSASVPAPAATETMNAGQSSGLDDLNFASSDQASTNLIVNYVPATYNEGQYFLQAAFSSRYRLLTFYFLPSSPSVKLRALFAAFGEVESCRLMNDKLTGAHFCPSSGIVSYFYFAQAKA